MALEGKITEDSVVQFEKALEKQTRAEIFAKLKFMTGMKKGKRVLLRRARGRAFGGSLR